MREFLKGLDLDSELIDTIMAEHGKYITGLKEKVSSYEDEIKSYKESIDKLNGTIEENNKSLENLQNLTNENKDLKAEIQLGGSHVKKEFSKFVRNEIMSQINDDNDFSQVLENYKKENPQYFGDTVVKKVQTSPTLNNGGTQAATTNDIMNNILRSARNNE